MGNFYGINLIQLPDQRSWDPRAGWMIRRGWKGTPTMIGLKILDLVAAKVRFDHEANQTGGYEIVTAYLSAEDTQPVTEELSDQWTLAANDLEQDLWKHPKIAAYFATLLDNQGFPTADYFERRSDIEKILTGEKVVGGGFGGAINDRVLWWDTAPDNVKKFVRSLALGVGAFTVSQFVLRNVKTVAKNYNVKPDYARVGKMLVTSEIQTIYAPPSTILFVLPDGFWLERTPIIEQVGPDRFTITREWWHSNSYDDFIYDR